MSRSQIDNLRLKVIDLIDEHKLDIFNAAIEMKVKSASLRLFLKHDDVFDQAEIVKIERWVKTRKFY